MVICVPGGGGGSRKLPDWVDGRGSRREWAGGGAPTAVVTGDWLTVGAARED